MIFSPFPGRPQISQWYGEHPGYYKKYNMNGHNGIDFAVPVGTQVYAPHEGYVHIVDDGDVGYGKHIIITSEPYKQVGTRRQSTLAHLSLVQIPEGAFVSAGDPVARSGNTGDSTGPHTHWTYKLQDRNKNTLDHANGFLGATDLAPIINGIRLSHILLWNLGGTLS